MTDPKEFSLLVRDRDHAAYGVVGAATVAVAFLNMEENRKALRELLRALETFNECDLKITEFHKNVAANLKKENSANGNRTAAA